ncbi:protein SYM1 isoform X2 [Coffea arabica]|uniref:Protein SYM1 isoform X2 n=1 Tax=Coffea arabica TaxID=13443 RepID=A0A6P6UK52_COFAR
MRLANSVVNHFTKRTFIQHSQQQRQRQRRSFSKFLPAKKIPQCRSTPQPSTTIRVPSQTPCRNSVIFFSFLHKSYYSSSSSSGNRKMGFLSWYLSMLDSRPILTKSISCSLIYAAADITSQMITMPPSGSLDLVRTSRMAGYGLVILGPAQHIWFNFIAWCLPKRDLITTLKKLVIGQLVFGPFVTSVFYSFNAAMQGETASEITARLKRDVLPTLLNGLMFWPLCDFFTYKIIPVHLQPLMNSSFSYIWTIYLTYMASLQRAVAN